MQWNLTRFSWTKRVIHIKIKITVTPWWRLLADLHISTFRIQSLCHALSIYLFSIRFRKVILSLFVLYRYLHANLTSFSGMLWWYLRGRSQKIRLWLANKTVVSTPILITNRYDPRRGKNKIESVFGWSCYLNTMSSKNKQFRNPLKCISAGETRAHLTLVRYL